MELTCAMVVLVWAPYIACEEFLGEGCALFGLTMPGVREAVYGICELSVRASVEELCQDGCC